MRERNLLVVDSYGVQHGAQQELKGCLFVTPQWSSPHSIKGNFLSQLAQKQLKSVIKKLC